MAAQAVAREGSTVAVVEYSKHVGGIHTSGLGLFDTAYPQSVGGLARQFCLDIGKYYGKPPGTPSYWWEPHVAERIFNQYLADVKATLFMGRTLASLVMSSQTPTRIQSIQLDDGTVIQGLQFIDASYEGDLMAAAGASYVVGRESRQQYGESLAGWGIQSYHTVSPYVNGELAPGINADPNETAGQADEKIMAYTFRTVVTTDPSNMAPFPKPAAYSPANYVLVSRFISTFNFTHLTNILDLQPTVNNKYILLNKPMCSVDFIGASWGYPDADWPTRGKIFQNHYEYVAGLLYFLANDPSVPQSIRTEIAGYGLPLDEFTDNQHWPWQMYVREGRRLVGQYIVVQSDVMSDVENSGANTTKPDSIGVGRWSVDSHGCDFFASTRHGNPAMVVDGQYEPDQSYSVFNELPFRCILPQTSEVTNLAVTCCPGASHLGFASLRVEPTLMILGEAAGTAAGMAIAANIDVSAMLGNISSLQARLKSVGAILSMS
jgi:hypothetical protein